MFWYFNNIKAAFYDLRLVMTHGDADVKFHEICITSLVNPDNGSTGFLGLMFCFVCVYLYLSVVMSSCVS